jgi:chromosome segregation ATPase
MKLNNFFEKRSVKKVTKKIISFNNEKKETELQQKINGLETEVSRLKEIETKNDHLVNSNNVFMNERSDYVKEIGKQNTELETLKLHISNLEPKATAMEDAVKSSKQHQDALNQAKIELQQVKTSRMRQDKNIDLLSKERSQYQIELKNVEKKYEVEKKTHKDVHDKYQHLTKEHKNLLGFSQENSKINIEGKKKIRDLERELNFLKPTVIGLQRKLAKADSNEVELKDWINSLKETIQENGNVDIEFTFRKLSDLILDHYRRYKKELEKPRYMSMESIARKEGFRIPGIAAAKNYNKLHLGNAKPTLLKFK